jgi:hypothetical protein
MNWCMQADYGMMVFADQRYQRHDKRDKLPTWITSHLKDSHLNLSTDMLLAIARHFMRAMAQPYDRLAIGKSLLTEEQVRGAGGSGNQSWRIGREGGWRSLDGARTRQVSMARGLTGSGMEARSLRGFRVCEDRAFVQRKRTGDDRVQGVYAFVTLSN